MRKVSVGDLKVGDKVVKLDRNWLETDLLVHKFVVKDNSIIAKLKKHGIGHVFIEMTAEEEAIQDLFTDKAELVIAEHMSRAPNYINLDEVKNGKVIYSESVKVLKTLLDDVKAGKMFSHSAAKNVASNIAEVTVRNKGVLSSIAKLKHHDDYTFLHSMNVSIFASCLASHLGMNKKEIERIAQAGLMHDVGKMLVPDDVLNKPGRLTEQEFSLMKSHVIRGYDFLKGQGVDESMLRMTIEHHERFDGSGYPNGLKDEQLSIEGKIGAVVDIYDAITSDRCYHKGMEPSSALRLMLKWTDSHINRKIFDFFVMNVGIYPVGSLVLMDNNELGVVTKINHSRPTEPIVMIFCDKTGRQKPVYLCDMSKAGINKRRILGPVNPQGIDIPQEVYIFIEKLNELK